MQSKSEMTKSQLKRDKSQPPCFTKGKPRLCAPFENKLDFARPRKFNVNSREENYVRLYATEKSRCNFAQSKGNLSRFAWLRQFCTILCDVKEMCHDFVRPIGAMSRQCIKNQLNQTSYQLIVLQRIFPKKGEDKMKIYLLIIVRNARKVAEIFSRVEMLNLCFDIESRVSAVLQLKFRT